MSPELRFKIENLPDSPGCYLMKSKGEIIYVGKAVNLKNRVRQYFHASANHTPKVRTMVEKIDDFDIVLVEGELEALILECNLIKRHMPWYNILLKDDKHYPFLRIDLKQPFPAVELVREQQKDGARYFGPYIGAAAVREVLDIVRMLFPVRHCTRALREGMKERPCLHCQVGQCLGPCAGLVSPETYMEEIKKLIRFLEGHYEDVLRVLKGKMAQAASSMNYERAAVLRDQMRAVNDLMQRQKALDVDGDDRDVFAVYPSGEDMLCQVMLMRSGRLISSEIYTLARAADENMGETLTQFIMQYYGAENPPSKEILVSFPLPESEILETLLGEMIHKRVRILCPQRGDKAGFIRMARKNLADAAQKREKKNRQNQEKLNDALDALKEIVGMDKRPVRIEGYDISNTQGVYSVASEVVMVNGKIAKKEYRHFRIKTVEGPNDFESMREVIARRFTHGLQEQAERKAQGLEMAGGRFSDFPDLILIDGGFGQLHYAQDAMRALGLQIPMFGLAERIDEIVLPNQSETVLLDRHHPSLHLIERLRDEAHRFAITTHRNLRTKKGVVSKLEEVQGIGPKRRKALLTRFSTMELLKSASLNEIASVDGMTADSARNLYAYLHPDEENS